MKQIIDVELKTQKVDFSECKTDLLAVGHFSDADKLDKPAAQLNSKLDGAIERVIKLGDFKGKVGTSVIVYGNANIGAKRVLLVGLGERKKATVDTIRRASANAANKAVEIKAANLSLALHRTTGARFDLTAIGQACAEGVYFGSYRYDEFVTDSGNGRLDRLTAELIDPDSARINKLNKGLKSGIIIGKAQSYARTLANRPANVINPAQLAAIAKEVAKALKLRYVSAGQIFRELAKKMKMSIMEFTKYVEKHTEINYMIDDKMKEEAKKGNVVLDSLLAFHFAKDYDPINVLVIADKEERARRIAKRQGIPFERALKEIELREESEKKRFRKLYGIEIWKLDDFDIIINTTKIDEKTAIELAIAICKILVKKKCSKGKKRIT